MPRATQAQHAMLQSIYEDFARQRDWPRGSGERHGPKVWKGLLIAAWERTQNYTVITLPAIDGAGTDFIYRRQSRLNQKEASELIEFARSAAVELDVSLRY